MPQKFEFLTCQDPGLVRQHSLTWLDAGRHLPHCGLHYDSCCSTSLGSNATYQILEEISSLNGLFSSGQTFQTRIRPLKCVVAILTNIPSYGCGAPCTNKLFGGLLQAPLCSQGYSCCLEAVIIRLIPSSFSFLISLENI